MRAAIDHDRADHSAGAAHDDAADQSEHECRGPSGSAEFTGRGLMSRPGFMGGLFAGLLGAGLIGLCSAVA